ncbi:MAG: hypothetical protein EAY75_16765 [Bacteroidetes bacterium]|nr:MAG: hypothetical protein EAY75_16765 [Bacteroidota bacterium]
MLRKTHALALCLGLATALASAVCAQAPLLSTHFKNLKARSIGPAGMSGRVTSIDAVHAQPNTIYVGAASGGVWKTENGGASWQPVFDDEATQNIGAVAIDQRNPSVVWVGTGEGNPRNSINLGEGIYKTLDGGKSWKRLGLEKTRNIHRILIDPTNSNTVYVAAIGNPYGIHPERGVYKTTDGGDSWQKILYTNDTSGCAELVMDPTNPNKLLANMWQHKRSPWGFSSGGPGGGLYMTHDGGKTWKKLGKAEGLPADSTGRMGLAIATNNPKVMYAMVEAKKNALYRSDDGGFKWNKVNDDPEWVTNRPFYFQDIRVDPQNENRLYNIYQMIAQSDDGGKSFKIIIPYSGVHPDHHAWWIHPTNPDFIINGNDGGIAISRDRGRTWQFDEKLPLGQLYHIAVDNALPYNVMGGLQDNGSWRGPAYVWQSGGIRNSYWQSVGGGDGFDVQPDPEDETWVYSMSQGGALGRQNSKTGEEWGIRPPMPELNTRIRFNWNAALALDPFDKKTIYYGSQFVHKSTNKGASWRIISPDLTTNNAEKQRQDENGGLTIDITNAENHCTILAIEPSKTEPDMLWVGTDDGQVQMTRDGGERWENVTKNIKGLPANCWIQQLRTNRYNRGEVFVVANNYRQGDFGVYIFRTTDYGKTWTRFVDDTKVKGYALCLIQDPTERNLFFVGTENGLWVSLDGGASFEQFKNNYPSVSTYDLAIQDREADLAIATFGRAIYIIDDIRPLRKLAETGGKLPAPKAGTGITVFASPESYQHFTNGPSGIEYSSYGLYAADNRNDGAPINFFVHPKKAGDTTKGKVPDSVTVKIFTVAGQNIRTYKAKADTGFNRIYWNYSTRGQRQPGSPKPRKDAPEPASGLEAQPGSYKVVVSANANVADSTTLRVLYDPRTTYPAQEKMAQKAAIERLEKSTALLTAAMDELTTAEEGIKKVELLLKDVEGKDADSLRKSSKLMQDSIKTIRESIVGKRQEKQGYGTAYQLTTTGKIREARQMILGKTTAPGPQEDLAITHAETLIGQNTARIANFTAGAWAAYKKQVEAMAFKILN